MPIKEPYKGYAYYSINAHKEPYKGYVFYSMPIKEPYKGSTVCFPPLMAVN